MNIGLLTGKSLSEFNIASLKPIWKENSFHIKLVIIDTRPKKSLIQKLRKHIKRGRGVYVLIMALKSFYSSRKNTDIESFCQNKMINFIYTTDLYSPKTIGTIRKYKLEALVLLSGFGIIKEPLLSVTPKGILSYHHGDMRKYRGMPPGFWELYNKEKEMGVTVQVLSEGLDCGIPVEEMTVEIWEKDSVKKLQERAYKLSEKMLYRALKKLSNNDFMPVKLDTFGKVYTLPNFRQWLILNLRLLLRRLICIFQKQ